MSGPPSEKEERFCRVCRCESTPDQPLYHPCKCRGSIKYIHQDCLQFWLQHSNKDTCDICHSKFQFRVIFKDGVPKRAPFHIILKSMIKSLIQYEYLIVKYLLMLIMAFIEVPLFIVFFDDLMCSMLGMNNENVLNKNFILSDKVNNLFNKDPSDNSSVFLLKLFVFYTDTISPGFVLGITYAIILTSMIIIQSIIANDEGFRKIINKKIGSADATRILLLKMLEKRRKLVLFPKLSHDYITQLVIDQYNHNGWDINHNYTLQELINIKQNAIFNLENNLHDYLTPLRYYTDINDLQNIEIHEEMPDSDIKDLINLDYIIRYQMIEKNCKSNWITDDQKIQFVNNYNQPQNLDPRVKDVDQIYRLKFNRPNFEEEIFMEQNLNDALQEVNERLNDAVPRVRQNQRQEINRNQLEEEPEQQNLFDGPKNMKFIFQITILANVLSFMVLFVFKQVPLYNGMKLIIFFNFIFHMTIAKLYKLSSPHFKPYLESFIIQIKSLSITNKLIIFYENSIAPKLIFAFFKRNFYDIFKNAYLNSINRQPETTLSEQMIYMFTFFSFVGLCIHFLMKFMENRSNPQNPLTGVYRTIYIILLEIVSVVKVFTLIAIEWAFFPLFCGSQIEFALVPVFNKNIYNYKLDPPFLGIFDLGLITKWLMGTFFMYFFASFVSLIRSKILRPGVLFFIRPSDDPNIQLVHDALMRPFSLRFSRIALSAAVYSAYIHIEFSLVSWCLRLFSPIEILPIYNKYIYDRFIFAFFFISSDKLRKPFEEYWKFVFNYSCKKFRLSSFLLNKDNKNERGRLVYKSFFARFQINCQPDYSKPVLKSEAINYFNENPNSVCCFVPDGNYVRAPDDDHVARQFVRTLFVPVTKSDELLEEIPEIPDDEEKYNPYGDIDPMDVKSYTIVYRPPNFKLRLAGVFGFLWFASLILTLGFYLSNILIGKMFFKLIKLDSYFDIPKEIYKIDSNTMTFTFICLTHIMLLKSFIIKQWNNLKNVFVSNNNKSYAIKTILIDVYKSTKNQIILINNNPTFGKIFFVFRMEFFALIVDSLALMPIIGGKITGKYNIKGFITSIILIPLIVSVLFKNKRNLKLYNYSTLLIVLIRINMIIKGNSSEKNLITEEIINQFNKLKGNPLPEFQEIIDFGHKFNISPDKLFIYSIVSKFHAPLNKLTTFLCIDEFFSVEAWTYFGIMFTVSVYIIITFLIEKWKLFNEKVKETYFDNQKVLSNADDNNDDDDDDNDDDIDKQDRQQEQAQNQDSDAEVLADNITTGIDSGNDEIRRRT